jgi:hypothetical protein
MAVLPKEICMFSSIFIIFLMPFLIEIEKSTLKFIWKHKKDHE